MYRKYERLIRRIICYTILLASFAFSLHLNRARETEKQSMPKDSNHLFGTQIIKRFS